MVPCNPVLTSTSCPPTTSATLLALIMVHYGVADVEVREHTRLVHVAGENSVVDLWSFL